MHRARSLFLGHRSLLLHFSVLLLQFLANEKKSHQKFSLGKIFNRESTIKRPQNSGSRGMRRMSPLLLQPKHGCCLLWDPNPSTAPTQLDAAATHAGRAGFALQSLSWERTSSVPRAKSGLCCKQPPPTRFQFAVMKMKLFPHKAQLAFIKIFILLTGICLENPFMNISLPCRR